MLSSTVKPQLTHSTTDIFLQRATLFAVVQEVEILTNKCTRFGYIWLYL